MATAYVDNAENRRLGRVGMPRGSMPDSRNKDRGKGSDRREKLHDYGNKQTVTVSRYIDNPQNRKQGRVGMPKGSMPTPKTGNDCRYDSKSESKKMAFSQQEKCQSTYVDNPQNRKLGRVGMPKGSLPVSKCPDNESGYDGIKMTSRSSPQLNNQNTYVDNPQNRKLGRVGKLKGSMPVSKIASGNLDISLSDSNWMTGSSCRQVECLSTYVDNPHNRKLGRVGMPKGSMPVSHATKEDRNDSEYNSKRMTGRNDVQLHMPKTYVDNTQNRRLGRVGMPVGSMPVSKTKTEYHDDGEYGSDGMAGRSDRQLNKKSSDDQKGYSSQYANNPQNRKLGRVGMTKGSMPVSKSANATHCDNKSESKNMAFSVAVGEDCSSSRTVLYNVHNTGVDTVGRPVESIPVSKSTNEANNCWEYDSKLFAVSRGQQEQSLRTYADNSENRSLGRVGMPKGSMPVSGNAKVDNCKDMFDIDDREYYTLTNRSDNCEGNSNTSINTYFNSCDHRHRSVTSNGRVYMDNPLNRRLGRVGKPIGTAVFSSKTQKVRQTDVESFENRTRFLQQQNCWSTEKKRPYTKKIPEMLYRLENDDEFKELTFESRTTSDGGLDFGFLDNDGKRVEAFDQAMYRYNRNQAEKSWKMFNVTKEAPKTQAAIIQNYRGKQIKFDDLKLQQVIGKGGFGLVYFAKWNDAVVAVKKINNEKISKSRIDDFAKEIEKFCTLEHKNIVKFIGACVEKSHPCIVMEYMQMTLYDALHIRNDIEFSEYKQDDMIRQICDGMNYLHNKRIVHCDLKTSNILLDYPEGNNCEVKITDFGLSMVVHDVAVSVEELVQNIGTPQYSSPEMLRGEILSAKDMMRADVYALAMVFLEVIFIEEPFPGYASLQLKKEVGERGKTPIIPKEPSIDRRVRDIMNRSWRNDPMDRPTMGDICRILRGIDVIFSNYE